MSKKCEVCGKTRSFGNTVSHSMRKGSRSWAPNVRSVKAVVDGQPKRIKVCTRCLRSGKVERAL